MSIKRQREVLLALLEEWVKILRLQRWDITLSVVPEYEISENLADVDMDLPALSAAIRICRKGDLRRGVSQEQLLVHELMHLVTTPLIYALIGEDENKNVSLADEQIVETLSKVLVGMKQALPG